MTSLPYRLIRSGRRSVAIQITEAGEILLRIPRRMSVREAEAFLMSKEGWVRKSLEKVQSRRDAHPEPDAEERRHLIEAAKAVLPGRVEHFAKIMGLYPTGIRITSAGKRFGSCSPKNSLCFSLYLMQYPQEAVDYVVVHELAHIRHKNHGKAFYALIESVLPDYRERIRRLKE